MKEALEELLKDLIQQNQEQLDFFSKIGLTSQMEFYAGKVSAYGIIESFVSNQK